MTIPNYLATFRQAVREREANETNEKSPTLISHNSLISHLPSRRESYEEHQVPQGGLDRPQIQKGGGREKSEISEKRVGPSFPYAEALDRLDRRCPDHIDAERWQQCIADTSRFLASWGDKAAALGWTAEELFGLHEPAAKPHPAYSRLSRYDCTGLLWLLQGRRVIALTANAAVIGTPSGGTLTYRKLLKPAYGPLGDSIDDFTGDGPEAA
jgi:hypothetical protein